MKTSIVSGIALILIHSFSIAFAKKSSETPVVHEFYGEVVKVYDGDSIHVVDESGHKNKVRVIGIDAPERKQEFGMEARDILADLILGQMVTVRYEHIDTYDRVLGLIFFDGIEVNQWMIEQGAAWYYKVFSWAHSDADKKRWLNAQHRAEGDILGLWSGRPLEPWVWRAEQKKARKARREADAGKSNK